MRACEQICQTIRTEQLTAAAARVRVHKARAKRRAQNLKADFLNALLKLPSVAVLSLSLVSSRVELDFVAYKSHPVVMSK